MRTRGLAAVAVLGIVGLSACKPADVARVEQAYRASYAAPEPDLTVDAVCGDPFGLHIVLTGYPADAHATVGIGQDPPYGDHAELDEVFPVAAYDLVDGTVWWSVTVHSAAGATLKETRGILTAC